MFYSPSKSKELKEGYLTPVQKIREPSSDFKT